MYRTDKIGLVLLKAVPGENRRMTHEDHLQQHLEICKRIYLRMLEEGSWPWNDQSDSPKSEDVVESSDKQDDI